MYMKQFDLPLLDQLLKLIIIHFVKTKEIRTMIMVVWKTDPN